MAKIIGPLNRIGRSFIADMVVPWSLEWLTLRLKKGPAVSGFQFERVWLIIGPPMIRREALNEWF